MNRLSKLDSGNIDHHFQISFGQISLDFQIYNKQKTNSENAREAMVRAGAEAGWVFEAISENFNNSGNPELGLYVNYYKCPEVSEAPAGDQLSPREMWDARKLLQDIVKQYGGYIVRQK